MPITRSRVKNELPVVGAPFAEYTLLDERAHQSPVVGENSSGLILRPVARQEFACPLVVIFLIVNALQNRAVALYQPPRIHLGDEIQVAIEVVAIAVLN